MMSAEADSEAESPDAQQKFIDMINQGQRGRMEDQRCSFDPSKNSEMFFNLLANTQSRRLDDQRVSLPTLPGLQSDNSKTRCSAPQIFQNQSNLSAQHKGNPHSDTSGKHQRSASLNRGKADPHQQVGFHADVIV
uniref:Uncharacterized protein n=1 Tax=Salarias fasciatus TaxID=181472 RepID=A0A672HU32_SALFA